MKLETYIRRIKKLETQYIKEHEIQVGSEVAILARDDGSGTHGIVKKVQLGGRALYIGLERNPEKLYHESFVFVIQSHEIIGED